MGDTHIKIHGDSLSSEESKPVSPTATRNTTRREINIINVTFVVGAAGLMSVATIGYLSFLYMTSPVGSQSNQGQVVTSEANEPLHIEKREQGACLDDLCLSKECVHAASDILKSMDNSVDPCDDFYRYACGGWIKDNEHQVRGKLVYSYIFNVLSKKIDAVLKDLLRTGGNVPDKLLQTKPYQDLFLFHERCREVEQGTQDMSPVHEVLRELDQFQVGKPFDPSSWDLTRALLQLLQINGSPFFDITIDSDVQRKNKFALLITSPRRFGLISHLKTRLHPHRSLQRLQEFLKGKGRHALFGEMDSDIAMLGVRAEAWAGVREDLGHHPLQNDAPKNLDLVRNLVFADNEEKEPVPKIINEASSPSTPFYLTPHSSPHTFPPQTSFPLPFTTTSTATTTLPTTTIPHSITTSQSFPTHHESTTGPATTTTTSSILTTTTTTTAAAAAAVTATMLQEQEKEINSTLQDEGEGMQPPISRLVVFRALQDGIDATRLESLALTLKNIFPNATVNGSSFPPSTEGEAQEDLYSEGMVRFLHMLHELAPTEREEVEIQQTGKQFNNFTVNQLNQNCPVIDWSYLLSALLNTSITEEHNVYVQNPKHLADLCSLLDKTEPWVIHYALLTIYSYDVLQEAVYADEDIDREDFCLEAVKGVFGEVMSNLYLHHIGNDTLTNIRQTASTIMEYLRETVEDTLAGAAGLREEDRRQAIHKLHTLSAKIGAGDKHWDIAFVNESHEQLSFQPNASFLNTVLELYRTYRQQLYQLYHDSVLSDDFIWSFTVQPYVVDAFYAKDINSIVLPEAFFHPPYHRHHAPNYLNFGSTATSMAHEIFHSLDFQGIQFDSDGLMSQPFSEEMVSRLNTTADCYHALLTDAFYEEVLIQHTLIAFEIDNIITKSENLADISGLRAAFLSYRRWEAREGEEPRLPALPLTPHQLFFVSAAQPYCTITTDIGNILVMELDEHLPNKMRINAMMKNLPEFSQTFKCSPTSKMFSNNTCQLF